MAQEVMESSSGSQQNQQQGRAPGAARTQLVQRLMDSAANLPAFIHDLLTQQAILVAGTEASAFLMERTAPDPAAPEAGPGVALRPVAHIRPDNSAPETRAAALQAFQDIIKPCIQQGKDGAIAVGEGGNDGAEIQFCLVTLLRAENEVVGATAVITRCLNQDRARQRLQTMQIVAGYFELVTLKRNAEQAKAIAQSHQHVLQLSTAVATAQGFESAAMNLCNELSTRTGAARVSVGWLKGRNIKVKALSHTEQFDKKQELIVQIEKAMEECMDQEEVVQYDPSGKGSENVTRAHQQLSRAQGGHIVLSLPLRHREDIIGVVTLEFLPSVQLGPHVAGGLTVASELLAPQLYDRYQNDRWLITKTGISIRDAAKLVIGPKHMLAKLIGVLVLALVLVVCNWVPFVDLRMTHKVHAPFTFANLDKRSVCAPYEGVLIEVAEVDGQKVRPGTVVKGPKYDAKGNLVEPGTVLAKMDTHELTLKELEAEAAVLGAKGEREQAFGAGRTAELHVAQARLKQAEADLKLARYLREQGTVRAPIDGTVLTGDLLDKQGSRVEMGKVLFEIAPLEKLRAEVAVEERDIQFVEVGQKGWIATTGLPSSKFPITVERIYPGTNAKEAKSVFTVHAKLDQTSPEWRPGMVGEARVEIQKKPIVWIYTHKFLDFIKMKLWL